MSERISQLTPLGKMKTTYPPKPWPTFNEWAKYIYEQQNPPTVKNKTKNNRV